MSVNRNTELSIIRLTHHPNPLDLRNWVEVEIPSSYQQKGSSLEAIGEGEMRPLRRELPPRGFVFHGAAILLELRKALLSWLLGFAIVVEPLDGRPSPFRAGLSGH
ncbi:MAG: hypothetical protein Q6M54_15675 [Thermostichus sp. DRC_bins_24]